MRCIGVPLALVGCLLLSACAVGQAGVAPVTTTPASTRYAQIDAVRHALGGDWSVPEEYPHTSCSPEGGEPDAGMQLVVTTTSDATRTGRDVTSAGDRAADALTDVGATVAPHEPSSDEVVVIGTDGSTGATTTVRVDAVGVTITHTTRCNDEIGVA